MSKLLFDSQPLLVIPELAVKIGLNESLVLQQIHYWININTQADKNYKDGYYWTYNSYEDWQKQFPFFSISTIKRTFKALEEMGILITGQFNKMKIDRTKWYRIDHDVLENIQSSPLVQNDTMDKVKLIRPIPETKTETTKDISSKKFAVENIDGFSAIYADLYKQYKNKRHYPVTDKYKQDIITMHTLLACNNVNIGIYRKTAEKYFKSLSGKQSGSIISFVKKSNKLFKEYLLKESG